MHNDDKFEYAEPQFIEHIPHRAAPTDPLYLSEQWHLNNTGQGGGTPSADIRMEEAWNMSTGRGRRIAVIDGGFDVTHPDLTASITPTSGYFRSDDTFVQSLVGFPMVPSFDHGTFCAGMALARANNAEGGTGVAYDADFIAIACLNDALSTQATLARAVAYAADPAQEVPGADPNDGADVISCSLGQNDGPWQMMEVLQNAIDFAVTNGRGRLGTPIFWATDNFDRRVAEDEVCSYANTIAVGRSNRNDVKFVPDDTYSGTLPPFLAFGALPPLPEFTPLREVSASGPELDFLATGVWVASTCFGEYRVDSGCSYAAPTAAGVAALMLSVNPDLTWQQVRDIMRATCDKIGDVAYDAAGHNDDYGFGRVNAGRAVCQAGRVVELDTPTVMFNDVPEGKTTARAITFSVRTCQAATFQIVPPGPMVISGPGSFGTLPSPSASLPATPTPQLRQALLWISFTGTSAGDITTGEVTIRLNEGTDEPWVIPITANTIARKTVGTVLVLDRSGSMLEPSGLPAFPTRADVLRFAAPHFVNVMPEGDGVGIVGFDTDAVHIMDVTAAGPVGAFDPTRATALGSLAAYAPNPGGLTAIGDGVEAANTAPVAAGSSFDERAMVVFTDGHETAPKYIENVRDMINERVFAIGLGTADQIQPTALLALTNGTGGYMLLTGNLGSDDAFLLSKYYLQILAGATNQDIVLDPEGAVLPGQKHRIPFRLNEADITADVILISQGPASLFDFALETPAGDLITPTNASMLGGMTYTTYQTLSFYRMTLPVPIGTGAKSGKWHIVLTVDEARFKRYLWSLHNYPDLYNITVAHGVRYNVSVQSSSGLRLQARMLQNSNEPGATLIIRSILTEYGLPIESSRAGIKAEIERPDNTRITLPLFEIEPGVYEAPTMASIQGVYKVRVLAVGNTLRSRPFTREHLLTGAAWKGGDNPPPGSDPTKNPSEDKERLCQLLKCLLGSDVITPELEQKLLKMGLNVETLRKCLGARCLLLPEPE